MWLWLPWTTLGNIATLSYFVNHGNVAECLRKLRTAFWRREALLAPYVRYLVKKVKETGILIDKPKREKPKTVRTSENIAAVAESVFEAPSTSIHRCYQQLNISDTTLRRILYKDLSMMLYKVQLVQELKPMDHQMRFRFAKWACDRLTEDAKDTILAKKKIIFSDEAHFDFHGYVNKQKFTYLGHRKPACIHWKTDAPKTFADFGPEA